MRSSRSYPLTVCFLTLNCRQFLNFSIASLNSIKTRNPPRQIGGSCRIHAVKRGRCRHVAGQTVVCHYHYSTSRRLPQVPRLRDLTLSGDSKFLLSCFYNRIQRIGCQGRLFLTLPCFHKNFIKISCISGVSDTLSEAAVEVKPGLPTTY